jgi:hypothetical protein
MERFTDNTYSLAKGLHHINIAKMYFDDIRTGTTGDVKNIFNQYIQKCNWIIDSMKCRLTDENRVALKKELDDSISFEAINDQLVRLDITQRAIIESVINAMVAGEEVKMISDKQSQNDGRVD